MTAPSRRRDGTPAGSWIPTSAGEGFGVGTCQAWVEVATRGVASRPTDALGVPGTIGGSRACECLTIWTRAIPRVFAGGRRSHGGGRRATGQHLNGVGPQSCPAAFSGFRLGRWLGVWPSALAVASGVRVLDQGATSGLRCPRSPSSSVADGGLRGSGGTGSGYAASRSRAGM